MNKIFLVIRREYITRVRKKSFIIMTILGPLLFATFLIVPTWLATIEDKEEKTIAVIDESYEFLNLIPETNYLKFKYLKDANIEDIRNNFSESGYYAVLYISPIVAFSPSAVQLLSNKHPSMNVKMHISNALEKEIERKKLLSYDIEGLDKILQGIKTNIRIQTIKWTDDGEEKQSSIELTSVVGYVSGFMIYFFIFLFGAQVMRGVIEEKMSRIVEVIVSSVKPFQLMMGKIIGIGLVGLTQFILWIILTFIIVVTVKTALIPDFSSIPADQIISEDILSSSSLQQAEPVQSEGMEFIRSMFSSVSSINFLVMLGAFLFYFLTGYLLYASLFAAIGSAVDSEADTQQFMMPITIPLILSIFVMMNAVQNPDGPIAFWFSIIPLTSPIVMMVRIPFGVPFWEISLSMAILVMTFIGTTWLAGKIYRTGILMYGKKTSYKELWKWVRYHN